MTRNKRGLFGIVQTICIIGLVFLLVYYINVFYEYYYNEEAEENEIRTIVKEWKEQSGQEEYRNPIDVIKTSSEDFYEEENTYNIKMKSDIQKEEASTQWSNEETKANNNQDDKDNNKSDKNEPEYDCILMIPSIEINKYVYTGNKREEYLEQYDLVTAAHDMKYQNGGNYIICGHYSKLYGHSLNRLKELTVGDDVIVWHKGNSDAYKVTSISYINMKNTTQYCNQTNEDILTIISCAKYKGKDKYLVVKCKYMN